jgi:ferredoxin-like protein FixX
MTSVITEPCIDVKDKTRVGECPVDCICEGERMLYIHPDECVDCGAWLRIDRTWRWAAQIADGFRQLRAAFT